MQTVLPASFKAGERHLHYLEYGGREEVTLLSKGEKLHSAKVNKYVSKYVNSRTLHFNLDLEEDLHKD